MAVLSDSLYLENIEEYVKDENRIVTYKWLSRTLSIPVNAAKMMLYQYVSQYSSSSSPPLSVMYCISGEKSNDSGKGVHVQLVSGKELEDVKQQYSHVWSVHVYSVQLSSIKDSYVMHASDHQVMRDHLPEYSKWNTISCDTVSCDRPPHTPDRPDSEPTIRAWSSEDCTGLNEATSTDSIKTTCVETSSGSLGRQGKKQTGKKEKKPKGSVSSFFNKKSSNDSLSRSKGKKATTAVKQEPSVPVTTNNNNSSINAVSDHSGIRNKDNSSTEASSSKLGKSKCGTDFTGLSDSDFEDDEDKHESTTAKKPLAKVKSSHGQPLKQTNNKAMSKTEQNQDTKTRKRRRRVQGMSSGDDESDTMEADKGTKNVVEEPKRAKGERIGKRRKRVRKLVSKMFVDDDGSMVTEKQWKEVSTDASSDEEKENGGSEASPALNRKMAKVEISSPSKRTKQSSLTSFFKK